MLASFILESYPDPGLGYILMRDHLGVSEAIYIHQGAVVKLLARGRPQESNEWKTPSVPITTADLADGAEGQQHSHTDFCLLAGTNWPGRNLPVSSLDFQGWRCQMEAPCDCARHRTGGGRQGGVVKWKSVFPIEPAPVTVCLLLCTSVRRSQCSNVHLLLRRLQLICPGGTQP